MRHVDPAEVITASGGTPPVVAHLVAMEVAEALRLNGNVEETVFTMCCEQTVLAVLIAGDAITPFAATATCGSLL